MWYIIDNDLLGNLLLVNVNYFKFGSNWTSIKDLFFDMYFSILRFHSQKKNTVWIPEKIKSVKTDQTEIKGHDLEHCAVRYATWPREVVE